MARTTTTKKKNDSKKEATKGKREDEGMAIPEGFNINAGRERGEGWIVKEEGNEVLARLLGRTTYRNKRGKERAFYQLRLLKPCMIAVENEDYNEEADDDDDNKPTKVIKADEGAIVNCDEFKKLEDMAAYTKDGKVYDVWFVMGGKIDIGDDQTMWTLAAGPRLRPVNDDAKSRRD